MILRSREQRSNKSNKYRLDLYNNIAMYFVVKFFFLVFSVSISLIHSSVSQANNPVAQKEQRVQDIIPINSHFRCLQGTSFNCLVSFIMFFPSVIISLYNIIHL